MTSRRPATEPERVSSPAVTASASRSECRYRLTPSHAREGRSHPRARRPARRHAARGCGEEEGDEALEAVEGEPLHLGELIYNVAITRFLNPNEISDPSTSSGQPPEPPSESYLGVFLLITNENDDEAIASAGRVSP